MPTQDLEYLENSNPENLGHLKVLNQEVNTGYLPENYQNDALEETESFEWTNYPLEAGQSALDYWDSIPKETKIKYAKKGVRITILAAMAGISVIAGTVALSSSASADPNLVQNSVDPEQAENVLEMYEAQSDIVDDFTP